MVILDLTRERGLVCANPPTARTLLDILQATVERHGKRIAIEAQDRQLSYDELWRAAWELAEDLRAQGIGAGDRVAVCLPSGSSQLYLGILAVLCAGAAYVPIDAEDPPARAAVICEQAEVCGVLEDGLSLRRLGPSGAGGEANVEDDAWVIFTSGSSGLPKGVAVSHRSAAAFVDAEALLWNVEPCDRVLAGLSVAFDASCEEMWLAWANGATLVCAPRALVRSGVDLGPWLAERAITVISTVPTLAAMWEQSALAGVRLLILGGEACPAELGWRLAAEREVWNTYGPTEATVVSTAARVCPQEPITIGWPLAGWDVAVVDSAGEPVAFGEPGELVIAGVGLGRYLDPELDGDRYGALPSLGWERAYRSGDIVRETIDGLEFVGRRDDQVKIGGRRLELGEVQAQLLAVPGVRAAAAVARSTAANNRVLVGYVVGEVEPDHVRAQVAEQLPDGLTPLVIALEAMPMTTAGKVDHKALPWPPAGREAQAGDPSLSPTAAWLAGLWAAQLGPVAITADTDFFAAGGSSVAAAKLTSALRKRYPAVAVSDIYKHRRLDQLAARLQELSEHRALGSETLARAPLRWGLVQLVGVLVLLCVQAGQWVIGALAYGDIVGGGLPHLGWGWLIGGWLLLASPMGRTGIVLGAKHVLLGNLQAGRYSRHSWLACRVWFLERLTEVCGLGRLAGTPWALRYARLVGAQVGAGARLGSVPQPASLVGIGAGATLEPDVDIHGWWIDGEQLVIGEVKIGAGARIGTRALLMGGSVVGEGAEVEPGSVVHTTIPAGERWGGSPARYLGQAGESWPVEKAPGDPHGRRWKALYGVGLCTAWMLPALAIVPAILILYLLGSSAPTLSSSLGVLALQTLILTSVSLIAYALLVAGTVRLVWRLLAPGWHGDGGAVAWALWFSEDVLTTARALLFPLYCSIYTRRWLRLMGLRIGRRTEISTAVSLNTLVSFGELSFAADDVVLAGARAREGWLHLEQIEIGKRTFLGNGALLQGGTRLGEKNLVGVLTIAPKRSAEGTCWFGAPALELPRIPDKPCPERTTDPPVRLMLARAAMDLLRILLPSAASLLLAWSVLLVLDRVGSSDGLLAELLSAPAVLLAAGLLAVALTVLVKWLVIGRYRRGEHPFWSFFVWRDELVNSAQEQLAGQWLIGLGIGTPLMSLYLRMMGSKVGRGVWCETLALTEFDLVELGDGAVVNRRACVETHLFHDRLMRIGSARIGAAGTLGPSSAMLPDTVIGAGACVGGRSVLLRGEELPAGTRWHGAPVVSM
ncbi:MAG: Pls/PosA family non-ribosomal peptide synthetase [Solirubrobacteraceae bacterium]